jgi:hypothetical protein
MSTSEYETLCAITQRAQDKYDVIITRLVQELGSSAMTRAYLGRLLVAINEWGAAFVAEATAVCGAQAGELVQVECDQMVARIRAQLNALLAKRMGASDATIH